MAIVAGVCPCNAFGGGSSKSTQASYDQRVAASEGSIAVGAAGKYLESDSLDISGSSGAKLGSTDITAGQNVNITTADTDVLKAALGLVGELSEAQAEAIGELTRQQTTAFSSFAKETHDQQSGDLATLLTSLGDLKQTTDEQAQQRKTFLYLVFGILALLGAVFFPWRKFN
jgi:hypothetical protein